MIRLVKCKKCRNDGEVTLKFGMGKWDLKMTNFTKFIGKQYNSNSKKMINTCIFEFKLLSANYCFASIWVHLIMVAQHHLVAEYGIPTKKPNMKMKNQKAL